MAEFFNSNQITPYVIMRSANGKITLGVNTPLTAANDFADQIGLEDLSVSVNEQTVRIEATIVVAYGAWTNETFDDVINTLVEEPKRLETQIIDEETGELREDVGGLWYIQFGWRNQLGLDSLSLPIVAATVKSDVVSDSTMRGSLTIKKELTFVPVLFLKQTYCSNMTNVNRYLHLQTNVRENTAQSNITPKRIFQELVKDLATLYPNDKNLPTLNSFLYLGTNIRNIGGESVYNAWVEQPLLNTSAVLASLDPGKNSQLSVFVWLKTWLKDNHMDIMSVPSRPLSPGGNLGFIIRFNAGRVEEKHAEYYQRLAGTDAEAVYAVSWTPVLNILDSKGILETATFSFTTQALSASATKYFREVLIPRMTGRPRDPRHELPSSDQEGAISSDAIKSFNLELLKTPQKNCSLTMMGQPNLSIFDIVQIDAGNSLFSGPYSIQSITHRVSLGTFTTEAQGYRILEPSELNEVQNVSKSEPQQSPDILDVFPMLGNSGTVKFKS